MKKKIKKIASTLLIVLAGYAVIQAQETFPETTITPQIEEPEYAELKSTNKIQFNNESKQAKIDISIKDGYHCLLVDINGTVHQGEALIELFDPARNNKGFFTIKTNLDISKKGKKTAVQETVNGTLTKHYLNPESGDWVIKVTPKSAIGVIKINTTILYNTN